MNRVAKFPPLSPYHAGCISNEKLPPLTLVGWSREAKLLMRSPTPMMEGGGEQGCGRELSIGPSAASHS